MPTYEYEIRDKETGETVGSVNLIRPVAARDRVHILRRTAPRSVAIRGAAPTPNQASEVLAGYRKQEEKVGSNRQFRASLGEFTPSQIKQAWSTPD